MPPERCDDQDTALPTSSSRYYGPGEQEYLEATRKACVKAQVRGPRSPRAAALRRTLLKTCCATCTTMQHAVHHLPYAWGGLTFEFNMRPGAAGCKTGLSARSHSPCSHSRTAATRQRACSCSTHGTTRCVFACVAEHGPIQHACRWNRSRGQERDAIVNVWHVHACLLPCLQLELSPAVALDLGASAEKHGRIILKNGLTAAGGWEDYMATTNPALLGTWLAFKSAMLVKRDAAAAAAAAAKVGWPSCAGHLPATHSAPCRLASRCPARYATPLLLCYHRPGQLSGRRQAAAQMVSARTRVCA